MSSLNGPKLVGELARLLAFAFETTVAEVYYESMADHPRKAELMGLFDKWGQPKLSYGYLCEVKLVIDGGYTVVNTSGLLQIVGRTNSRTLSLAHTQTLRWFSSQVRSWWRHLCATTTGRSCAVSKLT